MDVKEIIVLHAAALQVNLLDPRTTLKIENCPSFPTPIERAQCMVLKEKIYVGGGFISSETDKFKLFVTNFNLSSWSTIKTPVWWYALTSYESRVVLAGGYEVENENKITRKV